MGYNATIVVLTDRLSEIENDPEFGKKLSAAITHHHMKGPVDGYDREAPYVTGQTQVVEVHHADHQVVVTVGGNYGRVLGWGGGYRATDEQIIQNLEKERQRKVKEI